MESRFKHCERYGFLRLFKRHFAQVISTGESIKDTTVHLPRNTFFNKYYAVLVKGNGVTISNLSVVRD